MANTTIKITQLPNIGSNGFYIYLRNLDTFATSNETVTIRFIVQQAPSS